MRNLVFAFAAAALAVPAFAAPDKPAASGQSDQKPKKEKKICRHVADSASRLALSTCKTAEEWEHDTGAADGSRSSMAARPTGN